MSITAFTGDKGPLSEFYFFCLNKLAEMASYSERSHRLCNIFQQVTCEIVKVADATKAVAPGRAISSSFKYASSINEKRFESSGRDLLHQKGR